MEVTAIFGIPFVRVDHNIFSLLSDRFMVHFDAIESRGIKANIGSVSCLDVRVAKVRHFIRTFDLSVNGAKVTSDCSIICNR